MVKREWQIDCLLDDGGAAGSTIHWLLNGQWFFRSRFAQTADALVAVEQKYEELRSTGWTAVRLDQSGECCS